MVPQLVIVQPLNLTQLAPQRCNPVNPLNSVGTTLKTKEWLGHNGRSTEAIQESDSANRYTVTRSTCFTDGYLSNASQLSLGSYCFLDDPLLVVSMLRIVIDTDLCRAL